MHDLLIVGNNNARMSLYFRTQIHRAANVKNSRKTVILHRDFENLQNFDAKFKYSNNPLTIQLQLLHLQPAQEWEKIKNIIFEKILKTWTFYVETLKCSHISAGNSNIQTFAHHPAAASSCTPGRAARTRTRGRRRSRRICEDEH